MCEATIFHAESILSISQSLPHVSRQRRKTRDGMSAIQQDHPDITAHCSPITESMASDISNKNIFHWHGICFMPSQIRIWFAKSAGRCSPGGRVFP
jgi:hypothetical protein